MAFTLANAHTEVRARIQDQDATNPHLATTDDLVPAARMALGRFSADRTAELIAEITGAGSQYIALEANLTGWKDGLSGIRYIEYPAAVLASNEYPSYLDPALDYQIKEDLVGSTRTLYLWLPNIVPQATEQLRIGYTGVHSLDGLDSATATTIPTVYETAFYHLVAGYALQMFSNKMAQKGNPTINADVTNSAEIAGRMASNAKFWFGEYAAIVGTGTPGKEASAASQGAVASAWADWDSRDSGGQDFLFHDARRR